MSSEPVPIFCGACGLKTWFDRRCWNPNCGLVTPHFTVNKLTERKTNL
jgi:hypothetical protein